MIRAVFILGTLASLVAAMPAQAQMRVDARIHASSGSCSNCDLSNKRMNGMKLKNANFAGSVFNNSNLSGGQIDGSDLSNAHFRKALLYRLQGDGVTMPGAVMEDATLTEAHLSNSAMPKTNMIRADLSRVAFHANDMRDADLTNATATGGDFTGSNFEKARLDNINLQGAKLVDSNLRHAHFGTAILLETDLTGADLSGTDMSRVQGISQEQLNTACGDMNTRLPFGYSVPYCEGTLTAELQHNHGEMDPKTARAVRHLDRAIEDVEIILKATPPSNRPLRRKLQSIHADLVSSKRDIEK